MAMPETLNVLQLRERYRNGQVRPIDVVEEVFRRIDVRGEDHVWTHLADRKLVRQQALTLAARHADMDDLPLYGLPFGVKDNVHVEGAPTTCGCPGFAQLPATSADAVQRALDAGAIFIGKQTLDQFATGLNGTRTLGGHCKNTVDPQLIPGGSSSGSGVAVAAHLVSFSLGSDTGGSGRVPAAMNNIVGLRPSMGLVSNGGMVLNNPGFDCIPVFAHTVEDAFAVLEVIADPHAARPLQGTAIETGFRFGVPQSLEFFGDTQSQDCFDRALQGLQALGGVREDFDFALFHQAGQMIFDSAFVAERSASYGEVLTHCPQDVVPPVAQILASAKQYTAVEAFQAQYRLQALQAQVHAMMEGLDVLVTPTVPCLFTVEQMRADPLGCNAKVGYYTYGVGPLDLCAVSVPVPLRADGLPFGLSLVARAGGDHRLRALALRMQAWVSAQRKVVHRLALAAA
jgi:allophanate hydrolase